MNETTFYLVRHGEGEQNVAHILSSADNAECFGLTEAGREQVGKTVALLAKENIDRIFSSPLRRTRETAEIIRDAIGAEIVFDERLRETDFGTWSGKSAKEFWAKYDNPSCRFDGNDTEGLEGFVHLRSRVADFLLEMKVYSGERIVIVSHGDTLEECHGILTRENIAETISGWYPKKGEATKVVVTDDFWDGLRERETGLSVPASTDPVSTSPERK